ncbi:hypothetical protein BT69DRAFT_1292715 [Atractiella rhizophila]|nr:hypothetical protein BT69DRAFT_1292715 [Atractiella rhizophila]
MSTKPEEQHMEMGEDGKAPEKEKKKRNRISASCSTCRKKKGYPCGSCASRNDVCVWDGLAVPTVQRSTGDIVELRNQVDRLQQVVDSLVQVTQSALSQLTATVAARNAAPPAPSPAATITPGSIQEKRPRSVGAEEPVGDDEDWKDEEEAREEEEDQEEEYKDDRHKRKRRKKK